MSDEVVAQSLRQKFATGISPYGDWQAEESFSRTGGYPFEFTTPYRPALAWFQGKLWCVYRSGYGNTGLYYTTREMGGTFNWIKEEEVTALGTQGPSLAVFKNRLYCMFVAGTDNSLYFKVSDGNSWGPDTRMANHQSSASPALAVYADKLWCVHRGNADDSLWYTTTSDGDNWSADTQFPAHTTAAAPALAASTSQLVCVHRGSAEDDLWITEWDDTGGTWTGDERIKPTAINPFHNPDMESAEGPGLTYSSAYGGFIVMYSNSNSLFETGANTLNCLVVAGHPDGYELQTWDKLMIFGGTVRSQCGPALLAYSYDSSDRTKNELLAVYRGVNS